MTVVWVECRVVEVRVIFGLPAAVSVFERYVLKAILAGASTVQELQNVLEVSHRILVDALGDLWRAGHVVLDFDSDTERVALSTQTRDLWRKGRESEVDAAFQSAGTRQLLFDTLTGRLMSVRASMRPRDHALRVPRRPDDPEPKHIDSSSLIRAIDDILSREETEEGFRNAGRTQLRVLNAYLAPEFQRAAGGQVRHAAVTVSVAQDERRGLRVTVTEPFMSVRDRELATTRLQRMIDESPTSSFVQALARSGTSGSLEEPDPLPVAAARLRERVANLRGSLPGNRQREHGIVRGEWALLNARLHSVVARQVAVDLLDGDGAHRQAIRELIFKAETQLVMASPWISRNALTGYLPDLQKAIARGVQLVILWGIDAHQGLDEQVVNAIQNLQRHAMVDGRSRVLVKTEVPSRVHAKVLIRDDREALVTSYNFLTSGGNREVGLRISSSGTPRCAPVEDLLAWVHQMMPDHTVAEAIIRTPQSFGHRTDWPAPEPTTEPSYQPSVDADPAGGPIATAWALGWELAARKLEKQIATLPMSAQVVRDVDHQHMLRRAIERCERRLLITSDRLWGVVLDAEFRKAVVDALGRGVDVTLVYKQPREDAAEALRLLSAEAEAARVGGAEAKGVGRLIVRLEPGSHAKVLAWDDESVVGSFNFLSFQGHYSGRGRHRDRGEVSLHVTSPVLADTVFDALKVLSSRTTNVLNPGAGVVGPLLDPADMELATQVLARLEVPTPSVTGATIAELTTAGTEPFAVLRALDLVGAPPKVMERALASVVAVAPLDEAQPWWARLVELVWARGDFRGAHLLRRVVAETEVVPRELVTAAAAAWDSPELVDALTDAAVSDELRPDERSALILAGAAASLAGGDFEISRVLTELVVGGSAPLVAVAEIARRYLHDTGVALPAEALRAVTRTRLASTEMDHLWVELITSLGRLERFSPGYGAGTDALRHLYGPGGALSELTRMAQQQDAAAVGAWRAAQTTLEARDWVDAVTDRIIAPRIEGRRRETFVKKVDAIFAATLRTAAGTEDPTLPQFGLRREARDCANALDAALPAAEAAASSIVGPERVLALAGVGRLAWMIGREGS
jgi:phosphatidylserine/phosphatidylglycerophosphate/cardiolipin synthase-like enzyme